jgi:hypothetical protein
MIDHDGYPTEKTLEKLASFDPIKDDVYEFVEYLCDNWVNGFPPDWNKEEGTLKISTGGWSGCESVISALRRGHPIQKIPWFWTLYWYQSRRGGHYEFRDIKPVKKSGSCVGASAPSPAGIVQEKERE